MGAFKGFETLWTRLMMDLKMWSHIFIFAAGAYAVTLMGVGWYITGGLFSSPELADWWAAFTAAVLHLDSDDALSLLYGLKEWLVGLYGAKLTGAAFAAAIVPAVLIFVLYGWFIRRAGRAAQDEYIRGARLSTARDVAKALRKAGMTGDIPMGEITMPHQFETRHVFVVGKTGAGKTQALAHVLDRLRARGAKAVIYDSKGDFTSYFYDREAGDLIFNPLDMRCARWNIFNDLATLPDIEALAASLIPPPKGATEDFWSFTPRQVMDAMIHSLVAAGERSNAGFFNILKESSQHIHDALEGVKGAEFGVKHIDDADGKTSKNILSTLNMYSQAFRYMAALDGEFSIVRWLSDGQPGFIFISAPPDSQESIRSVISLFVDLLARKLLSLADDPARRVFFFLDEFGSLQKLPSIVSLLTLSRSKGGSCWLGTQDLGQIEDLYGRAIRQTIINNCATNLIMAVEDPETARFFSDKLGDAEVIETSESHSMGPADLRDGINLSRRRTNKKIVMPSELQGLKDLTGYLKLPGSFDPCMVSIVYTPREERAAKFIMRTDLNLDEFHRREENDEARGDDLVEF